MVSAQDVDALARSLAPSQRSLALRYCSNALSRSDRRQIRSANASFTSLLSCRAAADLLHAAGFSAVADSHVVADMEALSRVVEALRHASTTLLELPDELLLGVLMDLRAADIVALERTCSTARRVARSDCLWLRFCSPRFWEEGLAAGIDRLGFERWAPLAPILAGGASEPRAPSGGAESSAGGPSGGSPGGGGASGGSSPIEWRQVYRMELVWQKVRSRSGHALRSSLNPGCSVASLLAAPPALLARLPPAIIASLLVHDGQHSTDGAGLFFGGARLLSLAELVRELDSPAAGPGALLALTDVAGYQQLACSEAGTIVLRAGFNEHAKASGWAGYLERVLVDTV